jgi:hypothetical protein
MPTSDNLQTLISRQCANQPQCKALVIGRQKYCSDECRSKHTAAYRKAMSRLRQKHAPITSDAELFALLLRLAQSAETPGERRDARWRDLHALDERLFRHGPIPALRSEMKEAVSAIRWEILSDGPATSDHAFQYIRCLEILRDLGVENSFEVPRLRRYAWEVVRFYLGIHDIPRMSKALIAYAHTWRLDNHEYQARDFYSYPYQILRRYPGPRDPTYWTLRHNATLWKFRYFVERLSADKRHERLEILRELVQLAKDIGTPGVRLETYRELVWYWGEGGRDRDRALDAHRELQELLAWHPFPSYGREALLRPKIHALIDSGIPADRQEAAHLVETEFLPLYQDEDPHFYYYKPLLVWKTQLKLSFDPRKPVYGSPILTYLPRN